MRPSNPFHLDQARITVFANPLQAFGAGLTVALQRVATAVQPTAAALQAYAARPDIQARFSKVLQGAMEAHTRFKAIEAPGYMKYFEHLGYSGDEAHLHAVMVLGLAKRSYEEAKSRRIALMALHDLAKRPRWHPALVK